jgi:hypothetical protein
MYVETYAVFSFICLSTLFSRVNLLDYHTTVQTLATSSGYTSAPGEVILHSVCRVVLEILAEFFFLKIMLLVDVLVCSKDLLDNKAIDLAFSYSEPFLSAPFSPQNIFSSSYPRSLDSSQQS